MLTTNRATKTVASDQKQLKQLHDYAALGRGFRIPLTFHVKHRPGAHEGADLIRLFLLSVAQPVFFGNCRSRTRVCSQFIHIQGKASCYDENGGLPAGFSVFRGTFFRGVPSYLYVEYCGGPQRKSKGDIKR